MKIRRSLLSGFAAILWLSGGLLSSCQDKLIVEDKTPFGEGVMRLGDTVVAEVDGTTIYLSDVERAAAVQGLTEPGQVLSPKDPVFSRTLDELIDQRLLALGALRQALDQRDETRRRLTVSRERILGSVLLETHLSNTVNDETIRRMYAEQADLRSRGQERRARHILVAEQAAILEVQDRLESGDDFGVVAREVSIDRASREKGGDLGFFANDVYESVFTEQVFTAEIGTVSAPFKTEKGWHILRVEAARKPVVPTFEEMREDIKTFMTYDEIQILLRQLRDEGDVKLFTGQLAAAKPLSQEDASSDEASSESTSPDAPRP